jgi:hypothetical protein
MDARWNAKKGEGNVASRSFVVVFVVGNIHVFRVRQKSVVFRKYDKIFLTSI